MKSLFNKLGLLVFFLLILSPMPLLAQANGEQPISQPLLIMFGLAAIALLPFVIIMVSAFVKIAVVLGLIRSALGTQQIPPNQVITGLAMILTIYIMAPVASETYQAVESTVKTESNQGIISQATFTLLEEAFEKGREPLRNFLHKHGHPRTRELFYNMAIRLQKPEDRG
ncbi:MAG: EscR/YscR/HrcR family type III secretion system export apparatus protein, partial [Deltaproteobacteria bacterium]|nr:EscR/YscR/HrcR family type III secretion system export apparatus protein [Deltaproteobacteria bacterium]